MTDDEGERRGRLIAVIGLDGAGKTTQVGLLGQWLESSARRVEVIPNQSLAPVRKALQKIAFEDGYRDHLDLIGGVHVMRLISACSKLTYLDRLRSSLRTSDATVVVDRYTYCQYAAARAQRSGNEKLLRRLNAELPVPDLTIMLDVDPETALRRIQQRGIDDESMEFLCAFRSAYLELPESSGFVLVDGSAGPAEVQESLRAVVSSRFPALRDGRTRIRSTT